MSTTLHEHSDVAQLMGAAMRYAAAGWPVFPCAPGSKLPATAHGFKDATTDPAVIRDWWAGTPYNVAIATGAPGPDVLDVDVKGDGDGWAAYNRLKRSGLAAGASALVRTRSGGMHAYFAGTGQRNATAIGGVPLDFRGAGGYVLAPPSAVDGGAYEVIERLAGRATFDLAAARLLLDPPKLARPERRQDTADRPVSAPYIRAALAAELGSVASAPEGSRNATLNRAAFAVGRFVADGLLDADAAESALLDAACHAGLPYGEAARTIRSAFNSRGAL